jgi:hypothetical protein
VSRESVKAYLNERSREWERLHCMLDGSALCQQLLSLLERLWSFEDRAEVNLDEAARQSGYSRDHLRRLYRQQKLAGRKRGGMLYFRACDVPRKGRFDVVKASNYDPDADARRVAARRTSGDRSNGTQTAA